MTPNTLLQSTGRLYTNLSLWFSAVLLEWRSRQGFMTLMSLFRVLGVAAIAVRFLVANPTEWGFGVWSVWSLYLLFSLGITLIVVFLPRYSKVENLYFYVACVAMDLTAVCFFLVLSADPGSELYLLLLLPLIVTAHYLQRIPGLLASLFIAACYFFVLRYMTSLPALRDLTSLQDLLLIWGPRSAFLLSATWIYRVQGNFPRINETRIISPSKARANLETSLREFKFSVDYDTISVQLLYRGRLQIIACEGFANKKEIYQIEFPAQDKRYPNQLVINKQSPVIANPADFPSFKEAQYFADHVRTWLGVPLISPTTGECFGMLSIDSCRPNAYTRWDAQRAAWFAKRTSSFLIEAALGPAALTMITKREDLLDLLKVWSLQIPKNTSRWNDDLQAAREIVAIGQKVFNVEDCSIFFLRHIVGLNGGQEQVLHLVASSTIPERTFRTYESKVTGREGSGLTGLAVHRLRTLNYGASQIQRSPYRGTYTGHLSYLFSKRSRQILVVPLLDSKGNATGAIKLENRLGTGSESPFSPVDENMFEVFASMVSLMLENIRQRNFINRLTQNVHNLRAILHPSAIRPIDEMLALQADQPDELCRVEPRSLRDLRNTVVYTEVVLDGILAESVENLVLENEGLVPAIRFYIDTLKSMPPFSETCDRISLELQNNLRDNLPFQVRVAFYNIAREAVLNMVRHANLLDKPGGYGSLTFSWIGNTFHMTIQDNGTGIPPHAQGNSSHRFGLKDMQFQVETIRNLTKKDCGLKIDSQPDQGTRIHVWIDL
jgi:hypothetical protein